MEKKKEEKSEEGKNQYSVTVKSAIINALKNGNSVLGEDRKGINFSVNYNSQTAYMGVNQLYLNQARKDNGFKNPFFLTSTEAQDRKMWIKDLQKGFPIGYYCADGLKYKQDIYPLVDGRPDKSQNIIHKKGELKKDMDGKVIIGYDYSQVFNLEQVDLEKNHTYRKYFKQNSEGKSGEFTESPGAFELRPAEKIISEFQCPFKDAKKGEFYQAKDESTLEVFTQKTSEYFNSIFTGAEYKAWEPTKEQIAELESHIDNNKSPLLGKIKDANFLAVGDRDTYDFIQKRRELAIQKNNETEIAM